MRNNPQKIPKTPKKLTIDSVPVYTVTKTIGECIEEYRLENIGKADMAWNE
tara:strand:+ start:189 stop:341 length:153 start_codon:yes stop_codon:yes gene_type:complete